MKACNQTREQTILQHGLSVWRFTRLLLDKDYSHFKLPDWWNDYAPEIYRNLFDRKTIKHYTIWHDCGKPSCVEFDEQGRQHFPNHAEISYNIFFQTFGEKYSDSAVLIKHDMLLHTATLEQIDSMQIADKRILATLLISALAELHSNAQMFGGIESTGFKIKWKRYCKLGLKICQKYFLHQYTYVAVREDLSKPQQCVQSGHAILEMARHLEPSEHHPSIIICAAKDEQHLIQLYERYSMDFKCTLFREPDIGNQATAFCVEPVMHSERKKFNNLKLLK